MDLLGATGWNDLSIAAVITTLAPGAKRRYAGRDTNVCAGDHRAMTCFAWTVDDQTARMTR